MQSTISPTAPSSRPAARRARVVAVLASLGFHALILTALVLPRPSPPQPPAPEAIRLALVVPPQPPKIVPPVVAKQPAAAKPSAPPRAFRQTPPPRDIVPLAAQAPAPVQGVAGVSDGELDGAATADSGAPGGACDMVRALQAALRKDALVQAAVTSAGRSGAGKAILVWNGDWVTTPGEAGRGLSAVREAILWQVGFSPPACRSASVHGLVAISLSDTPGVARLVLGGGDWRWSDLLTPRGFSRSPR